jgi:hypothetical protein
MQRRIWQVALNEAVDRAMMVHASRRVRFWLVLPFTFGVFAPAHRRAWLIALCVTAKLTVAAPAAAQSPASTAATSARSVAHEDNIGAPNAADADVTDLPTKLRSPLLRGDHPPVDRFAGNVRIDAFAKQRTVSGDSLRNGAIIGTVIGAAAFGAFAAALCNAYQEEDDASCVPDTLRFGAIGGAIGAGAGLAIDAARDQRGVTVRFAVRF